MGWENGQTKEWFDWLYALAGQGGLYGEGRSPPRLDEEVRWAIEHLRKYPKPPAVKDSGAGQDDNTEIGTESHREGKEEDWVLVHRQKRNKDILSFI